jgi:anti-anti-sigma factor
MKAYKRRSDKGVWIVEIEGQVDADQASSLKEVFAPLLGAGGSRVVVCLLGVSYMDSTGLGTLFSLVRQARYEGGDVVVYGLSGQVEELFKVMRLERVVYVVEDEAMAIEKLGELDP